MTSTLLSPAEPSEYSSPADIGPRRVNFAEGTNLIASRESQNKAGRTASRELATYLTETHSDHQRRGRTRGETRARLKANPESCSSDQGSDETERDIEWLD